MECDGKHHNLAVAILGMLKSLHDLSCNGKPTMFLYNVTKILQRPCPLMFFLSCSRVVIQCESRVIKLKRCPNIWQGYILFMKRLKHSNAYPLKQITAVITQLLSSWRRTTSLLRKNALISQTHTADIQIGCFTTPAIIATIKKGHRYM